MTFSEKTKEEMCKIISNEVNKITDEYTADKIAKWCILGILYLLDKESCNTNDNKNKKEKLLKVN